MNSAEVSFAVYTHLLPRGRQTSSLTGKSITNPPTSPLPPPPHFHHAKHSLYESHSRTCITVSASPPQSPSPANRREGTLAKVIGSLISPTLNQITNTIRSWDEAGRLCCSGILKARGPPQCCLARSHCGYCASVRVTEHSRLVRDCSSPVSSFSTA